MEGEGAPGRLLAVWAVTCVAEEGGCKEPVLYGAAIAAACDRGEGFCCHDLCGPAVRKPSIKIRAGNQKESMLDPASWCPSCEYCSRGGVSSAAVAWVGVLRAQNRRSNQTFGLTRPG